MEIEQSNMSFLAECTFYDLKQMLERKKVKSWLKSVSAFANTEGGSLFFGVDDSHTVVGLQDVQSDADFISECINDKLDPVPEYQLLPLQVEGKPVLELRIKKGIFTPYYLCHDGSRTAFVRHGNESVVADSRQILSLVLKGSNRTWDSLSSTIAKSKHSFIMLSNAYRKEVGKEFEDKLLESWGLVDADGMLTNAGLLFADDCPVYQSRVFCTRWNGLKKTNAINDSEYKGNLIYLLEMAMSFIRANTATPWVTQPTRRQNNPDYAERAIFEVIVNHLIHRDYTVMGSEVHVDIYDDRLVVTSPGGMYDGTKVQERDLHTVASCRRNPILADVFTQLDYMEKRGSGLLRIQDLTAALPTYTDSKLPSFASDGFTFYTTVGNVNYDPNKVDDTQDILGNDLKNGPKGIKWPEKWPENIGDNVGESVGDELTERQRVILGLLRNVAQNVAQNVAVNTKYLSEELKVNRKTIQRDLSVLLERKLVQWIGPDKGGHWEVIDN